jgi:hypothetical protein
MGGLDHSRGIGGIGTGRNGAGILPHSFCSLLGLILGVALASWNYARVAAAFKPIVRIDAVADAIGFLLIAVA